MGRPLPPNILAHGPDTLLAADEAARVLGVKAQTVRAWSRRGKLRPSGLDNSGVHLYRFHDLLRAATTRGGNSPCPNC
ncbi:transcriptional regulator, MerR family [Segniliparus rotundus DSM 44985]|uniref:Transcriptional regulator, MerR family n=1 Tax=Segniliparus rotundus (strain ATCC BAA-972 / CDC 1076 / CIP 108378 / DSM 44985 / JCM 13578) TaxID=640132 RepID=D6ZFC1_SEGRD|nr:helix-turn-helix domain-containing protein [Segniliparus rotundus]ADG97645.1 transcriptional regulator, MerR family [Segniliparus rotundus DSM 44985]